MGDERVSVEEVAEAGDILAEEVDVLLERLTDKVLASPGRGHVRGTHNGIPITRQTGSVGGYW
jgi:hypothetical protein